MWFQQGSKDEDSDRDNDGIIDAIDDCKDLILGYEKPKGNIITNGLISLGYSYNLNYPTDSDITKDITYYEIVNGYHNQSTWKVAIPHFLKWAYSK